MEKELLQVLFGSRIKPGTLRDRSIREALEQELSRLEPLLQQAIRLRWDLDTGLERIEIREVARELNKKGLLNQSNPNASTETTWWIIARAQLALKLGLIRSESFQRAIKDFQV